MLVFWTAMAHADCVDLEGALHEAETAVAEYRLEDASPLLKSAEDALSCSWADPTQVARLWNAQAVVAAHQGRDQAADTAFAAARRASEDEFNSDYGSKMHARWASAPIDTTSSPLTFTQELPETHHTRIDGQRQPNPWTLSAGLHLVQVGMGDAPQFGSIIDVLAGQPVRLEVGIVGVPTVASVSPVPAPAPTASPAPVGEMEPIPVVKYRKGKPMPLLGLSGTTMVSGTVLLGLALLTREVVAPFHDDPVRRARADKRQKHLGFTGYGVLGLGVVGTVIFVAI